MGHNLVSAVLAGLVGATSVLTVNCPRPIIERKDGDSIKPLMVITGGDSQFDEPAFFVLNSRDEWQSVWLQHLGMSFAESIRDQSVPRFEFDFDSHSVVAIFLGEKSWAPGVHFHSIEETADNIVIKMEPESLQTLEPPKRLSAYAFVLLPQATGKEVLIFQGHRDLKAEEPEWTQQRISKSPIGAITTNGCFDVTLITLNNKYERN